MSLRSSFLFLVVIGSALAGVQAQSLTREALTKDLEDVARVASVMVDGDVCQRIMTERALTKLFVIDPQDEWAGSDNFDVNAEPYIQIKKTLIRLSRLRSYPIDCNLWMLFKENPKKIQVLIRNRYEMSQFWRWGVLYQDIPQEMAEVISTGKPKTVAASGDFISVLTPVTNSLGDIVGLVEVVSRVRINPQEHVK